MHIYIYIYIHTYTCNHRKAAASSTTSRGGWAWPSLGATTCLTLLFLLVLGLICPHVFHDMYSSLSYLASNILVLSSILLSPNLSYLASFVLCAASPPSLGCLHGAAEGNHTNNHNNSLNTTTNNNNT